MAEAIQGPSIEVMDAPIEQRLRYDGVATSLHAQTLSRLMSRRKLSERSITRRYDDWGRVDDHCRQHIDLSRQARNADKSSSSDTKEMPWARAIVVPVSYAILEVFKTQLIGLFTKRDPPIEIEGTGPEDVKPAKLMNAVIAYDQVQCNYVLSLQTVIQDALKYGMGGFHDGWEEELGWKTVHAKPIFRPIMEKLGIPTSKRIWGKLREYQHVEAWDPYSFFPDPRVSLSNIQSGEFCGHRLWRGYLELLANSIENGGNYFNVEQVAKSSPKPQAVRNRNRWQVNQMNLIGSMDELDKGFHALDSFTVTIIPEMWKLGPGTQPEKWRFAWVDDQVIIRAHRADPEHEQFPYSAMESNIDTHVFGNQGSIEMLDGLARFMNWTHNSHLQNQIRMLNNRMIYSSMLIEDYDIENPDAGMNVRLTALGEQLLAGGKLRIEDMYSQMQIQDITTPMVQSVNQMFDFAMRMSGAADQMMGQMTKEKRTLGEVARVGHEGTNRMAMLAQMMDMQGVRPLALRWASNRQQYTTEPQYVKIAGDLAKEFGADRIRVRPEDLYGNYDYAVKLGGEEDDHGQIMLNAVGMIGKSPEILGMPDKDGNVLDIHEMIKEGLRGQGVKNINDFYRSMVAQPGPQQNVQVMPDEQLAQQSQAGNVVPINQAA